MIVVEVFSKNSYIDYSNIKLDSVYPVRVTEVLFDYISKKRLPCK